MIELGLVDYLKSENLNPVIGARIYPSVLPQNVEYPAIAYQRISGVRVQSNDGDSNLVTARYQLTLFSQSFLALIEAAKVLRDRLKEHNRKQAIWPGTDRVDSLVIANDTILWEPGDETHRIAIDVLISYAED